MSIEIVFETHQYQLWGNVYHQGTRWQGSHAVVPLLVALIADPTTPGRAVIVDLLTAIAIGDRPADQSARGAHGG